MVSAWFETASWAVTDVRNDDFWSHCRSRRSCSSFVEREIPPRERAPLGEASFSFEGSLVFNILQGFNGFVGFDIFELRRPPWPQPRRGRGPVGARGPSYPETDGLLALTAAIGAQSRRERMTDG